MISPRRTFSLLKETFQEWQDDKCARLAAALAYYTVFSLAPLLIIVIAIVGAIFGEQAARGEIVEQIGDLVGREGAEFIQTAIENADRPDANGGLASLVSIVIILFGASGVFTQLQDSLNTIWEVKPKEGQGVKGLVQKRLLSFGAVFGIGFLLLLSLLASAILSAVSAYLSDLLPAVGSLWYLVNFLLSFGIITLLFAMIYKFLPDVRIQWSDVWIGAAITAFLFVIGNYLLGLYLSTGALGSAYGAAGSLIVLLAWIYYSAQILFFGAEFTHVYTRHYGSGIEPSSTAESLTTEDRAQQGIPRQKRE